MTKKVMVFGTFDGLHPGHLNFFKQAKKFGEFLVVSVGRDRNVTRIKGKKPLFNENERLDLIANLKRVDKAILGDPGDDFMPHIVKESPDVICLGYDQWAKEDELEADLKKSGLEKVKIIRLKSYKPKTAKSKIIKKKWL